MRENRTESVFTKITKTERKKLKRLADRLNMSMSAYIQFLIQRAK